MMEWLPRETIEPTKMILPIQRMTTREEVIEDQLQEIEDVLAPGIEDQDLAVEEGDLILAKEGEAEVEIVGAVAVTEEAEAETGDEIEAVREEKERWSAREESENGDVVMREKGKIEDEEKGRENVRGRRKWQES